MCERMNSTLGDTYPEAIGERERNNNNPRFLVFSERGERERERERERGRECIKISLFLSHSSLSQLWILDVGLNFYEL